MFYIGTSLCRRLNRLATSQCFTCVLHIQQTHKRCYGETWSAKTLRVLSYTRRMSITTWKLRWPDFAYRSSRSTARKRQFACRYALDGRIASSPRTSSGKQQSLQNRRALLAELGLLPCIGLWPRQAVAAEGDMKFLEPETSVIGRFVEKADGWLRFETLDFQLDIPPTFQFVNALQQPTPQGRGRAPPPSAVKASFADSEGRGVTVVEYSASQIKPTFFQLADISQYGSVSEVARLLTPPGVRVLSTSRDVIEQPERDTGTVIGRVKAAPQTIYRFEYQLSSGIHVATAAVARAGKVLLAGGTASSPQWNAQPDMLKRVIDSFQLAFPN